MSTKKEFYCDLCGNPISKINNNKWNGIGITRGHKDNNLGANGMIQGAVETSKEHICVRCIEGIKSINIRDDYFIASVKAA